MAPPFLHPLFDPKARPRRIRIHLTLIVLSIVAFAYSLTLPAIHLRIDRDPDPRSALPVPGLSCLLASMLYYPSNLLLCVAPLTSWSLRQRRVATTQILAAAIALCSLTLVMLAPSLLPYAGLWLTDAQPVTFHIGF